MLLTELYNVVKMKLSVPYAQYSISRSLNILVIVLYPWLLLNLSKSGKRICAPWCSDRTELARAGEPMSKI